jgi:hypothetical protein
MSFKYEKIKFNSFRTNLKMENDTREELNHSFKNAANALTVLYKESLLSNKIAYKDGYKRCLQDLWGFISSRQSSSSSSHINTRDLESFISLQSASLENLNVESSQENSSKRREESDLIPNFSKKSKHSHY